MIKFVSMLLLVVAGAIMYFSAARYKNISDIDKNGLASLSALLYVMVWFGILTERGDFVTWNDHATVYFSYAVVRPFWPIALLVASGFSKDSIKMVYATLITTSLFVGDAWLYYELR